MSWEQTLVVDRGKVWFEGVGQDGIYKVIGLLDCRSETDEPFKVWFEKVDYEPEFEVPNQETAFFVNDYVSKPQRAVKFKARQAPSGEPPPDFREFCRRLVQLREDEQERGWVFSTDMLVRLLPRDSIDRDQPLRIFIGDPPYECTEGNFVRFAHFEKPFKLIPDTGKVDLQGIRSVEGFAQILKEFYGWPLEKE